MIYSFVLNPINPIILNRKAIRLSIRVPVNIFLPLLNLIKLRFTFSKALVFQSQSFHSKDKATFYYIIPFKFHYKQNKIILILINYKGHLIVHEKIIY